MADRGEAKRGRAEARERRREQADEGASSSSDASAGPAREQAIEEVKHAAKVAAASAAVGAAVAGARALTTRHGQEGEPQEDDREPQEEERPPEERGESAAQNDQPSTETSQPEHKQEASATDPHEARAEEEKPIEGVPPGKAKATVRRAREQLESLLERRPESVSALEHTHEGWVVTLEVVEVSRIPESTDVLASYEMELDDDGNLRRYARVRRYRRSQADNGERA